MNKLFITLLSIPKTFWVNLRYLDFRQAIKLPIIVSYDTSFKVRRGELCFECPIKMGMIRIGFHEVPACHRERTKFCVDGTLVFKGEAHIGNGSSIYVSKEGFMELGDDFKISASSSIICYHEIVFGRNIQFSWDCLVMDSDTHTIYDELGNCYNLDKPISFGDNIWIGCRSTILKGSFIPNNCVIGSMSLVSGKKFEKNTIIAGVPARSIKNISGWKL